PPFRTPQTKAPRRGGKHGARGVLAEVARARAQRGRETRGGGPAIPNNLYIDLRQCALKLGLGDREGTGMAELLPPLLSVGDLMERWSFSRQGVNQLIEREGHAFPVSQGAVNRGRIRLWLAADI